MRIESRCAAFISVLHRQRRAQEFMECAVISPPGPRFLTELILSGPPLNPELYLQDQSARFLMPKKTPVDRARADAAKGKSPSTQAGEFVHEEIEHIREGKHGARSAKQAIAIGLSKARRAGVKLPPPQAGASEKTESHQPSKKRSEAATSALQREGKAAASHQALSRQAQSSAGKRGTASRHDAAVKAARTARQAKRLARG